MEGKGRLEVGYDGDIALVDLSRTERVGERGYQTKCGWSPFEGLALTGWVHTTIVRGHPVYREGSFDDAHRGGPIRFTA